MKKITVWFLVLLTGSAWAEVTPIYDPQGLLDELRHDLTGIKANFIQYEVTEQSAQSDLNSGTVWMQTPHQFRWHYQQPYEQLIVADGQNVWVYDEDLDQVTVKAQNNELNPIYVMINAELSKKHYDIKHEAFSQGVHWISMTPKQQTEEVKQVWLGLKDAKIDQIKVSNHFDQTMVFQFIDVERNPKVDPGMFKFEVPEGVDVIKAQDP